MLELSLRIGFSLLVVFALMWGIAKVIRRPLAGRGGDLLSVVTRQQLTRAASVSIVRVGERALVLGVTDQQVTLLTETTMAELEPPASGTVRRSPVELDEIEPGVLHVHHDSHFHPNGNGHPSGNGHANEYAHAEGEPDLGVPVSPASPGPSRGALAGSALSPQTWAATVNFLRERTVRR